MSKQVAKKVFFWETRDGVLFDSKKEADIYEYNNLCWPKINKIYWFCIKGLEDPKWEKIRYSIIMPYIDCDMDNFCRIHDRLDKNFLGLEKIEELGNKLEEEWKKYNKGLL